MTDEEYARERLGIFPDDDGAPQWEVVTEEQWEACGTREQVGPGWLGDPPTFAVEFTVDRSAASIGVAGRHPNGGVAVEVIDRRDGVDWVLARLVELGKHRPKAILIDPRSPAGSIIRRRGNTSTTRGSWSRTRTLSLSRTKPACFTSPTSRADRLCCVFSTPACRRAK
jgi:hypothetical protein